MGGLEKVLLKILKTYINILYYTINKFHTNIPRLTPQSDCLIYNPLVA